MRASHQDIVSKLLAYYFACMLHSVFESYVWIILNIFKGMNGQTSHWWTILWLIEKLLISFMQGMNGLMSLWWINFLVQWASSPHLQETVDWRIQLRWALDLSQIWFRFFSSSLGCPFRWRIILGFQRTTSTVQRLRSLKINCSSLKEFLSWSDTSYRRGSKKNLLF